MRRRDLREKQLKIRRALLWYTPHARHVCDRTVDFPPPPPSTAYYTSRHSHTVPHSRCVSCGRTSRRRRTRMEHSRLRPWAALRTDTTTSSLAASLRARAAANSRAGSSAPVTHLRHGRPHRIRGWALVRWAGARLAQRRYLRLVHYALTVFDGADENVDLVLLEQVLVGTRVTANARKQEIVIRTPDKDKIVVSVRTQKEFDAWKAGFADAAREPEQYYTLVHSRRLGAGAFSEVFFGFDRDNGDHAAIKVVNKRECTRAMAEHAETEARIMAIVHHPAIIACRDIFDGPDTLHVVLEFMSGGTLEDRIKEILADGKGTVPEHLAATVLERVLSALVYLEAEGICHRDIKPDNILIGAAKKTSQDVTQDSEAWATTVRVSDFGLAAFVKAPGRGLLTDFVGTPEYVAPEMLARCADNSRVGYGCAVDVWAVGVIAFWMMSGGELPFDGDDTAKVCRAIKDGVLKMEGPVWDKVSAHGKSFVRSLLQPCPRTRLSAAAALTHPWMLRSKGEKRAAVYAASASAFAISRATGPARPRQSVFSRRRLSAKAMLRTACVAVTAANRLCQAVIGVPLRKEAMGRSSLASTLSADSGSESQGKITSTKRPLSRRAQAERMVPGPERAPIGTDGLGYNVGLFRSFAPKQRLHLVSMPPSPPPPPQQPPNSYIRRATTAPLAAATEKTTRNSGASVGSQRPLAQRAMSLTGGARSHRRRTNAEDAAAAR